MGRFYLGCMSISRGPPPVLVGARLSTVPSNPTLGSPGAAPSRFVALVGMVTLLHGTGCSWIFIQKPPPGPVEPVPPVECTSSNEYSVVDSIVGWPLVAAGTVGIVYGFLPTALAGDAPWPVFWGGARRGGSGIDRRRVGSERFQSDQGMPGSAGTST